MGHVVDFCAPALDKLRKQSQAYKALKGALGYSPEFIRGELADHIMTELWRRGFMIVPRSDKDA